MPIGRLPIPIAGTILLLFLPGCGREGPSAPAPPAAGPVVSIGWLRPEPDAVLADTVRAEVSLDGPTPVRLVLEADGLAVDECRRPPWRFLWFPSASVSTVYRLRVLAGAGEENEVSTGSIRVAWSPNAPPVVHRPGVEERSAAERSCTDSLRVEAFDPEEGRLDGRAIRWSSDLQGLLGSGRSIPVCCLVPGVHRLRVRATDRWLRSGEVVVTLEAFDYGTGSTPEGVLGDLRHALASRDPDRCELLLSESFQFLFCPSDRGNDHTIPSHLDRAEEVAFVRSVLGGGQHRLLSASWRVASLRPARLDGGTGTKAELVEIELRLVLAPAETLEVIGGSARVYLRPDGSGRWRIDRWRDLGAASRVTQGSLRLSVLDSLGSPVRRIPQPL